MVDLLRLNNGTCMVSKCCGQQAKIPIQTRVATPYYWHIQSMGNKRTRYAGATLFHKNMGLGALEKDNAAGIRYETLRAKPQVGPRCSVKRVSCIASSAVSRGELYLAVCGGHDGPNYLCGLHLLMCLSLLGKLSFPRNQPVGFSS